ncbi:MAG: RNA repair transcriptional activator RtcR [Polyangiales bacterium]
MAKRRSTVVIGLLGTELDKGMRPERWSRWRPTVAACQHADLRVDRFELLMQERHRALAEQVARDIAEVSPDTTVNLWPIAIADPWDLEEVYGALHDFAREARFRPDDEDYLAHITTGSHVAQISMFLLAESRRIPARLLQTSPPRRDRDGVKPATVEGTYRLIDLDLSRYDRIASRFQRDQDDAIASLKAGIATRSATFNRLIERIELVAARSRAPMLLMGPTGAGKSQLARRVYELRKGRHLVRGEFVDLNCATVRGDAAASMLFGHVKGSYTGALSDRPGLLRKADGGVLFLDEIGELGLDEQAMLLRALEEGVFYPVGSDREARSDFQLIAGTNRDLAVDVSAGRFRDDLLARINLWTFRLPGLRERSEDIDANLDYELERAATSLGTRATFNREARARFLEFATGPEGHWRGNFRDLNAAVTRMVTLAPGGRIDRDVVDEESARLRAHWASFQSGAPERPEPARGDDEVLVAALGREGVEALDRFDRVQLADVLRVCRAAGSLSAAGRVLFAASRARRTSLNDADRLRKYLARFGISWQDLAK